MNNNSQRRGSHRHLDRRSAHIFSVGIDIERMLMFGLNPNASRGKVLDFTNVQMPAKVNGREHAEELEAIHAADDADVKQPVIHFRPRSDPHPSAIQRSVRERCQSRELLAARSPICGRVVVVHGQLPASESSPEREQSERWSESGSERTRRARAASAANDCAPRDLAVESKAGHTAKVSRSSTCGASRAALAVAESRRS